MTDDLRRLGLASGALDEIKFAAGSGGLMTLPVRGVGHALRAGKFVGDTFVKHPVASTVGIAGLAGAYKAHKASEADGMTGAQFGSHVLHRLPGAS